MLRVSDVLDSSQEPLRAPMLRRLQSLSLLHRVQTELDALHCLLSLQYY